MPVPLQDFECVHRLFVRTMEDLVGDRIVLPAGILSPQGTPETPEVAAGWLWLLEAGIGPQHFRQAIERSSPAEHELQALARYFARKRRLGEADIERLEWLVTYIFRNPATSGGHTSSTAMLNDIERWLEQPREPLSGTATALLSELVEVLEDLVGCRTLKEMTQGEMIERGRRVKQKFQQEFVHPKVLAAIVNYNIVSRRRFDALLAEALAAGDVLPTDVRVKEYHSAAEDLRQLTGGAPPPARGAPENLVQTIELLGIDPALEEGRLSSIFNELAAFARAAGKPVSTFPLAHSAVELSPWEAQSLVVEYPGTEKSFRAELNRATRRAVCLLAAIQEESKLYEIKRHSEHHWKKHVDSLIYLLCVGRRNLESLDKLTQDASTRGLKEKADQLVQTAAGLRSRLQDVEVLYQTWKAQ